MAKRPAEDRRFAMPRVAVPSPRSPKPAGIFPDRPFAAVRKRKFAGKADSSVAEAPFTLAVLAISAKAVRLRLQLLDRATDRGPFQRTVKRVPHGARWQ